jgi:DNA-binding transcriptional ArsR family regulator
MPTTPTEVRCDQLERIFHEPNRLAIMSALCAERDAMAFTALKEACRLTDGNLSRHLKALEESGAVRLDKRFVENKPRTTVHLTTDGLARFQEYLEALNEVLVKAKGALPAAERRLSPALAARTAHA